MAGMANKVSVFTRIYYLMNFNFLCFVLRVTRIYYAGRKAYNEEKWLEAVDLFESSLVLYQEELSTCRLLCEDVLSINLTQPDMNEQKRKLFEEHSLEPDAMEYYELLALITEEVF